MVMHQSALPSNVMPLLCGIMLLFTLLRLPIYLSCLVLRFIFFSIRPFLQRDASRSTLSCSETRICLTRIIHTIVYLFVKLLEISNLVLFLIQKRRYSREKFARWTFGLSIEYSSVCCSLLQVSVPF